MWVCLVWLFVVDFLVWFGWIGGYLHCCTYTVGFCFWFVGGLLFGGRILVCLVVVCLL